MADTHYWWIQQGFYPFNQGTGDDAGYPNPGQVVKFYREQKLWKQKNGSEKRCRQVDLAEALGVSESWVRAMENTNEGLDSIARRRALIAILGIPPILLGLGASDFSTEGTKEVQLQVATLSWYRDTLQDSWQLYYTGTTQDLTDKLARKLQYLRTAESIVGSKQQRDMLELQCRFYLLAARVASDQQDYNQAISYLKTALKIANQLQNNELIALTLFWRGRTYLEKEDFESAKVVLDKALTYISYASTPLKGAIYLETGLAHAYTATTEVDKKYALLLFDKAAPIVKANHFEDDMSFVKLNLGRYYQFKAEALIAMSRPEDAIRVLDMAEQNTNADLTRRRGYINILRAKASLDAGDYSYAAFIALDAIESMKAINSGVNLSFIKEITNDLVQSDYGNSSEVARLRRELQSLK